MPYSASISETNSTNATITVYSPGNLSAAYPVMLNVSINRNASLQYSLGNASYAINGSYDGNNSYFAGQLNGSLAFGIFKNGEHTIRLDFYHENITSLLYSFAVNDSTPPQILSQLNASASFTEKSALFNISTDELASVSPGQNVFLKSWNGTSGLLNISLENGYNEFSVSAADFNNNTLNYSFFVNASIAIMNCSDGAMNYHDGQNESGVDCGGSCGSCIALSVSTDKPQYTLGELAYIHVIARNDAPHNITVTAPEFYYSLTYLGSTYYILNPTKQGNYKINVTLDYKGSIESQISGFSAVSPVQENPLSLSITANATTSYSGDWVKFEQNIAGNSSRASFRWDFDSDNQNESEEESITRLYNQTGAFNVTLHATDGKWNFSAYKTVEVKGVYRVEVLVADNATMQPIDAEVSLGGQLRNTSNGAAAFEAREGTHELVISAKEYEAYAKSVTLSGNLSINASLKRKRPEALLLSVLSPGNNTITSNTVIFSFKVEDSAAATCGIYISAYAEEWKEAQKKEAAGITEFSAALPNGTSYWKINCTDAEGRSNTSETLVVEVNANALYVDLEKENRKAEDAILKIEQSIELLKGFDTKEAEMIEDMQLEEYLNGLKKQIERANRDLHNLKWRRLNQTEQAKLEKELVRKVEDARNGAIKDLRIIKSAEFVNYPKEPDIELLSSLLYRDARLDMAAFNEKNVRLQSYATATTKYRIAEITYETEKKTFSIITKKMSYSRNISEDFIMYEIIPKEFSDNASRITFLFDHEVIEQDPVIRFSQREPKFSYYVEGEISLADSNRAKTVIMSSKPPLKKQNEISGNAILGIPFKVKVDIRVMAEIIIILLLIIFYFAYSIMFPGVDKNLAAAQKNLQAASSHIVSGDYDKARAVYSELRGIFGKLKPEAKKRLYPVITGLNGKIDALYLKKKIVEANLYVESNPRQAHLIYSDVAAIYRRLPEPEKKEVHKDCAELNAKIAKSMKNEKPIAA